MGWCYLRCLREQCDRTRCTAIVRKKSCETDDEKDDMFLDRTPVQRVERGIRGLRNQNSMTIPRKLQISAVSFINGGNITFRLFELVDIFDVLNALQGFLFVEFGHAAYRMAVKFVRKKRLHRSSERQ
jgi:hypothetical protein